VSARYRQDEQALVQLTRRTALPPRERRDRHQGHELGRAALRTYEDLQVKGYEAYRNLLNQATTTNGAKP
jgi:hypothetical protein